VARRIGGDASCARDSRNGRDAPPLVDPTDDASGDIRDVQVAAAVEGEAGRLVEARLGRRASIAVGAAPTGPGEYDESPMGRVPSEDLVSAAVCEEHPTGGIQLDVEGKPKL
jgi:hypothetical protein